MADAKSAPLTKDQRSEVRLLLQRLSQQSTARAQRRGTTRPALKATKKLKRMMNPFDGIEQNKHITTSTGIHETQRTYIGNKPNYIKRTEET